MSKHGPDNTEYSDRGFELLCVQISDWSTLEESIKVTHGDKSACYSLLCAIVFQTALIDGKYVIWLWYMTSVTTRMETNVVVESWKLLIRILEVRVQILARRQPDRCFFVVFLSPTRRIPDSTLKLGHDRFLPNPFQFIIHLSPFHSIWKVNQTRHCSTKYRVQNYIEIGHTVSPCK
jgi:hypothetical protein